MTSDKAKLLSALVIAGSLATGIVLRVVRLGTVPPGLHQDEACDGYDAYSILTTGRDHRGNFLPLVFQGFNDYRMPLFDYSLVPLVGTLGLRPAVIRLGAAIWGIADLGAMTALCGMTLGWPGAAAASLLGAFSPWHLSLSRYGIEATAASATISLAMVCFFLWLGSRTRRWLLISAGFFGLSLYSYSITKAVTPLLAGWLAILYRRELRSEIRHALAAAGVLILLAAPQAAVMLLHREMQAQFRHLSIFNYMSIFNPDSGLLERLADLGANWLAYFTPSYLFLAGDRGDHWTLLYPPGFGMLLPEQAPLIVLGLVALFQARRRRIARLILGWLIIATVPAALTVPLGAWRPETRTLPTAWVMFDHDTPIVPLTPSLLLAHPDSRHDAMAMVPWIALSALGFVVLLDLTRRASGLRLALSGLFLAGAMFHGVRFARAYFRDFPILAAPYFQYGMEEVVRTVRQLDDGHEPIVITDQVNQPYIYVLFFERYSPALFQRRPVLERSRQGARWFPDPGKEKELFAPVLGFDNFAFVNPRQYYPALEHGIFVFAGGDDLPGLPVSSIRYPDGTVAYSIIVK